MTAGTLPADHGDVGGHPRRRITATVRAGDLAQVRELVRQADPGSPLYPVSTGRNWGMGSGVPAADGCTVLDLSLMRRIRTLDLTAGYAVIEPGVTQRQLAAALVGTPWLLNTTSSCADTSVIGNALERGDGCLRSRNRDVLGVEAVLADGSVLATGGLDLGGRYRGLVAGPDLTAALTQSNLGVITAMAVSLVPRPEATELFFAEVPTDNLGAVIEALARLVRGRLPTVGTPCAANLMTIADGHDGADFAVMAPLLGSPDAVALARRVIEAELGALVPELRFADAETVAADDPLHPRAELALGLPTCRVVHRTLGIESCDVDAGPRGFLALMPLLPVTAQAARVALAVVREAVEAHPVRLAALEWNFVSPHVANGVVQILFDRDPQSVARAHRMREQARGALAEAGFPPYRSNIDHAERDVRDRLDDDGVLAAATAIKRALDPRGLIAPSRYLPAARSRQ